MRLRLKTVITAAGAGLLVLTIVLAADPASLRSAAPVEARVYIVAAL